MKTKATKTSGFTLVELAIVIVIIGLIIGGVLVGQDLIKAATIRSAVSDIEKFNAASTTFRGKYNGLPGDLAAAKAIEFGLSGSGDANAAGTAGLRDGNSTIDQSGGGVVANLSGEVGLFWKDLGATGLIGGSYTGMGTAVGPAAAITAANVGTFLPRSKLRDSAYYLTYQQTGRNMFYIASITGAITTGAITATNALTPLEAKSMDEKLDDGAPTTGIAITMTDLNTANAGAVAATTVCNTNASPSVYNVSSASTGASSNVVCQMQLRTSF